MPKKKTESSKKEVQVDKTPEINIGLFGHVDHGKTTLTEQLSGKWTDTHSEELKRGITIRLGYADTTIRKIPGLAEPECYTTKKEVDGKETEFVRRITFVDAPGHESLMATMLSGATMIDGAIVLISATEECPQPQTREHLMALEILGINNVIIVQNKIDLADEKQIKRNFVQIKKFIMNTPFAKAPIIPLSAQHGINIDLLIEAIEQIIPTPKRDTKKDPIMLTARSFDINKPGSSIRDLKGGVLGGILLQGKLKVGDTVQMQPVGINDQKGSRQFVTLTTKIVGLNAGSLKVDEVTPGGTIGLMTSLDPAIVKGDSFSGVLVGKNLPPVLNELDVEMHLLERVVGTQEELSVDPIKKGEVLMLNVNGATTVGMVTNVQKNKMSCKLKLPVCLLPDARITISRRIGNRFRLIGYAVQSN